MPMYQNQIADLDKGYVRAAAGGVDAATSVASLFPGGVIPQGTKLLMIVPEAQAIRWRSDGVAPTTTVGYPLAVGAELRYTAGQFAGLQVIASTAGAILNVYAFG
jgi:hypothetical protein